VLKKFVCAMNEISDASISPLPNPSYHPSLKSSQRAPAIASKISRLQELKAAVMEDAQDPDANAVHLRASSAGWRPLGTTSASTVLHQSIPWQTATGYCRREVWGWRVLRRRLVDGEGGRSSLGSVHDGMEVGAPSEAAMVGWRLSATAQGAQ
jgi:hypothetical protein